MMFLCIRSLEEKLLVHLIVFFFYIFYICDYICDHLWRLGLDNWIIIIIKQEQLISIKYFHYVPEIIVSSLYVLILSVKPCEIGNTILIRK